MSKKIINDHFNKHIDVFEKLKTHIDLIYLIGNEIRNCLKKEGKLLICGNGGSASDAQHIAAELIGRYVKERVAVPAISLSTDTSVITAISNDYGYRHIFSRQISAIANSGDIVLLLSTSGNSLNIVEAIKTAKNLNLKTIGFFGANSGKAVKMVDHSIRVPSKITAHIQEAHIFLGHIICSMVDSDF
tara:strand:+ start:30 stop:593 length:564 start_codon:yes stop_codon:yes gene_type:complete